MVAFPPATVSPKMIHSSRSRAGADRSSNSAWALQRAAWGIGSVASVEEKPGQGLAGVPGKATVSGQNPPPLLGRPFMVFQAWAWA